MIIPFPGQMSKLDQFKMEVETCRNSDGDYDIAALYDVMDKYTTEELWSFAPEVMIGRRNLETWLKYIL